MKALLLFILSIFTVSVSAQKIEENRIDDFTKNKIVRTSWEKLIQGSKGIVFIQLSKINDNNYYLGLKMMLPGSRSSIFSIYKGSSFMLKSSNEEILDLKCIEGATTDIGDGAIGFKGSSAYGIYVRYSIPDSIVGRLKSTEFNKIRIYTDEGYVEYPINKKKSEVINRSVELIIGNTKS